MTITNGLAERAGPNRTLRLPALAGALRVCRAMVERLFDLRDARGLTKRVGELSAEDTVPRPCGDRLFFVMRATWRPSDFLL